MLVHHTPAEVLCHGLELFGFKPERLSEKSQNKRFREQYGCSPVTVAELWKQVELAEDGGELKHLFWTLHFFKAYPLESSMRTLYNACPEIIRKWIRLFTFGIASLKDQHVSIVFL